MKFPLILTNFKTYESATGAQAVALAKIHQKVSEETGVQLAVAVQLVDLAAVASAVSIPVFAQHVDAIGYGANTGYVLPEAVKAAGAYGTLLNHSEHQLDLDTLRECVARAQEAGLFVIACAQDHVEAEKVLAMGPNLIAVEPPGLIGGTISVATAQPDLIKASVAVGGGNKITLVGAGVKNSEDVRVSIQLGACGVLLASGVTKAADPEKVLRDLVSGVHYSRG